MKTESQSPAPSASHLAAPSVNGVALTDDTETLTASELRQRACTELLRQAAIDAELLAAADDLPVAGVTSQAASDAIEALLERALPRQVADAEACQRYYDGHTAEFMQNERVQARHILFAVTPRIDVNALAKRAEACLIDLRCEDSQDEAPGEGRFARVAAELSNCPSRENGGDLGWMQRSDCAPEFAAGIFGNQDIGVLPQLLHSRFGLHVVEVLAREPGHLPPFDSVRLVVEQTLERQQFITGMRQYLQLLAGQAKLNGIDLDASDSPLVQ